MTPAKLRAGVTIGGRYRIEAVIGEGGMGTVFRATQLNLGRPVALKVIHAEAASHTLARQRFEREARVAASLAHPNAIRIYDFGEADGHLFMAMEMLHGASLRDVVDLDLPPLPVARAVRIGLDLASVLTEAHAIGLVHRDLKPENVFMEVLPDGGERTVLLDFGLAFIGEAGAPADTGRLTRRGVVTGTPDYMSPEQARGDADIGPATDVYSLGCMLFEMLTARCPFLGEDAASLLAYHMFVEPPPLRDAAVAGASIPAGLERLVERMLVKVAEDRPTAAEVRETLGALDPAASERMGLGHRQNARGRAARMISAAVDEPRTRATDGEPERTRVGVLGPLPDELRLALATQQLVAVPVTREDAPALEAVFAPGLDAADVAELARAGCVVVADAERADTARLSELLRAGAAEVVLRPLDPPDLGRKLLRAVRKARRRRA